MREVMAVAFVVLCVPILNAGEAATRTPADDLRMLQGAWEVTSTGAGATVPKESRLDVFGNKLAFEGNRVTHDGKVVMTLANDVTLPSAEKEIGVKDSRLLMLTLPDGRGLLCNYRIADDVVRIQYPHTSFCNRSGCSIILKRPSK